jgi:hypothetical protein
VSAAPAKKAKTGAQLVAHEIKLIQIGRTALGLDEDTYRQMLSTLCGGKSSSKQLTWQERKKVLDHMKACGFQLRTRAPAAPTLGRVELQMDKLRKIWHELALRGAVEMLADLEAVDAAIEAWSKRMLRDHPGGMRLLTARQMSMLIEAMKKWCLRVGVDLDDGRMAEPTRKGD